jgi:hypothetical protein
MVHQWYRNRRKLPQASTVHLMRSGQPSNLHISGKPPWISIRESDWQRGKPFSTRRNLAQTPFHEMNSIGQSSLSWWSPQRLESRLDKVKDRSQIHLWIWDDHSSERPLLWVNTRWNCSHWSQQKQESRSRKVKNCTKMRWLSGGKIISRSEQQL